MEPPITTPQGTASLDRRPGVVGRAGVAAGAVAPPTTHHRRILSLHLPRFAMDRWQRMAARRGDAPPADMPRVLAVEGPHGPVVHATNHAAEAAGITRGARVVDMRAICPELQLDYADPAGDRVALRQLMLWARRWCPWTAVDGDDALVMDTTGSAHLWGDEAGLMRQIETDLSRLDLTAALAIAPTHGAAWALARYGGVRLSCSPEELAARLAPLPVKALRLHGDTAQLLARLGLKTIRDLAAVPRVALARRFARAELIHNPYLRLDQAMGHLAEPVNAPDDPPRFETRVRLAEAVQAPTDWIPQLTQDLSERLHAGGFGLRRMVLSIYRVDGEVSHVAIATARPTRDAAHMARLFDGKLDRLDPGYGFDLITLGAVVVEALETTQNTLDGDTGDDTDTDHLIDRLTARFGAGAIRRPAPKARHIPERAEDWRPAMAGSKVPPPPAGPERPLRLLEHPEEIRVLYAVPEGPPAQFVWRKQTHRVTRFAGPERIAPEWWLDRPGTRLRDYYKVEDHSGLRLWLYRKGVLGDDRGQTPRWFLHGMFG